MWDLLKNPGQLNRYARRMAWGLVGLGLLIGVQFGGLTWYSALQLDQNEVSESITRVQTALNRERDVLVAVSREYGWWSQVITKMIETQDQEWIDINFGIDLMEAYNIGEILALNAHNDPRFAQRLGETITNEPMLGWTLSQLQPLIDETQASPMDIPEPSIELLVKNGELYVVSACAITHSDPDAVNLQRRPRPTLFMIVKMDDGFLNLKAKDLALEEFTWSRQPLDTDINFSIGDSDNAAEGFLSWNVRKPGAAVMKTIALWSLPTTLLILLGGTMLLRRMQTVIRLSQDIETRSEVIEQSQNYFQSMSDNAPVLIWQTDMQGNIVYGNRQFYQLWNEIRPECEPGNLTDLPISGSGKDLMDFIGYIKHTGATDQREYELHAGNNEEENARYWLSIVGTPQRNADGDFDCILFSASDVTDRKGAELQAWQSANFDSLTELPNRSLLKDRLEHELSSARRKGTEAGLMFIDLDNFKKINDSLGHGIGDKVLQGAANRILHSVRSVDTVARLGGDEFVVLLPEAGTAISVSEVAQRIQNELGQILVLDDGTEVHLTASIGVANYPHDGEDSESLMMHADTAMYRAKNNGRNDIAFYDSSMHTTLKETIELESQLRSAIQKDELFLVYQPLFKPKEKTPVGFEALCRWTLPDGSMVSPKKLIPIAEGAGLMRVLGDQLLVSACKQLKQWQMQNRQCFIALNLSAAQFADSTFANRVQELIAMYDIDPHGLQLEFNESVLLHHSGNILEMLKELSTLGIKLAVDDFGTGYSALSYLRRFPVDTLKIDRSFISELHESQRDQDLVRAIIAMARSLGLNVIAEGVETQEQLEFLHAQDCDLVQGYLLGRPAKAADAWAAFDSPGDNKVAKIRPT